MIETFKNIRFKPATLALIEHANGIIDEYQALGFTLTLRQLFYQFVSRPGLGLANTFDDYKRLGRTVTDARRDGLIDWDAIEDRTRNVRQLPIWGDPSEIVGDCANQYRQDAWASQLYRPEVWIEKDALTGVRGGCPKNSASLGSRAAATSRTPKCTPPANGSRRSSTKAKFRSCCTSAITIPTASI
jgi:hypothetical protein